VKQKRKPLSKTPRDIIGEENVAALKQAGFVVLHLSELSRLRDNVKSALDMLSDEISEKDGA
jgi:predicted Fe-Mo cluster-binding NifX family protein